MTNNCENCGSWLVRAANFCHRCGQPVAPGPQPVQVGRNFEYSGSSRPLPLPPGGFSASWKDGASTTILLVSVTGIGAIVGAWPAAYVGIVPLTYLLWQPASRTLLDLLGRLPERSQEAATTLRVEYKSEDNRHWLIDDYPANITPAHLKHIARKCLEPPLGEGARFSRRKVAEPGKLSQGEFEAIRDLWLGSHYAFYKNELAPSVGIVLTERCTRLLRKALNS